MLFFERFHCLTYYLVFILHFAQAYNRKDCIEACLQAEMLIFPYFDSTLALYAEGVFGRACSAVDLLMPLVPRTNRLSDLQQ